MSEEEITTIKRYFENKDYVINGIKVHDVIQEMIDFIEKQQKEIEELEHLLTSQLGFNIYRDFISKDKIREKIKKAKEIKWHIPKLVIEYFEELLEEK